VKRPAPGTTTALRGFFAWLERHGGATVPRAKLVAALPGEDGVRTLDALAATGVVREGPRAETLPCGEGIAGCAREVRTLGTSAGGGLSFVGVCGNEPRACATIDVAADELRQVTVSVQDLVHHLRTLLRLAEGGRCEGASAGELAVVGSELREDGSARLVVLVVRPRDTFLEWLESRSRGTRAMLVLLPTSRALPEEAAERHGPGALVEVDTLAEVLQRKGASLALAPRVRPVEPPAEPPEEPTPAVETRALRLPLPRRWEDVKIRYVDGETVSVEIDGKYQRVTHIDMGLARRGSRKATKAWDLLLKCCEGRGRFRWNEFGKFENARQVVARLRKALKAAFGLEKDPFHDFSHDDQWRTRFRAEPD
jgi:hypothetical protein